MNKLVIIGNLTRDPETRTIASGNTVCSFTIAVNRRRAAQGQNQQPEADFFRVSAWNKLGEVCQRFLAKGRKVCVVGSVSVSSYEGKDGSTRFSLDVSAEDVEFLSPRNDGQTGGGAGFAPSDASDTGHAGFQEVDDDDLPF
jgi:single-strand DNA-binding protein